ncbi:ODR4 protein, partial [Amia calva]|nr:ODR4 protein [Amia calva]
SSQRDFVVWAVQSPEKEAQSPQPLRKSALGPFEDIDEEWVNEHARQVSRMLPGGLAVLGVFLITPPEQSKEAQTMLRRLVFAVEKSIMRGKLWTLTDDDVSERVTLHICSKTKKVLCRTFDMRDPKSSAKPADWKYQSGVSSSWSVLQCNVEINLQVPLSETSSDKDLDKCIKTELQKWANLIEGSVCLINGQVRSDDKDFMDGQHKHLFKVCELQVFCFSFQQGHFSVERTTASVQFCSASISLQGVVCCKAYIHSNKPKVKQAIQALKRDVLNTVSVRTEMLFEDFLLSEGDDMNSAAGKGQHMLPRRVFAPVLGCALGVCDYMFPDEAVADLQERFREMLDCDINEEHIDMTQEVFGGRIFLGVGYVGNIKNGIRLF